MADASKQEATVFKDGDDFSTDLRNVLDKDFKFTGSFYYSGSSAWPEAPDPEINIAGVGRVDLPLNEEDAKKIISVASRAPFGKGEETIVDTVVRDTWEIDPSNVSFENKDWAKFMSRTAEKSVWKALGVAPFSTKPRCELHKMLLYEPGSHFLPHQDTAKADGMFATIIVVLPCDFEGGEVHLSHAGQKVVLDVAKQASDCKTSVLAWYTDVIHEIKPVTSGYRLALSYNLIHASPTDPIPAMPNIEESLAKLRNVLLKWRDGDYANKPEAAIAVRILDHQYSKASLSNGLSALKGADAFVLETLVPVAEELGLCVCLAEFKRYVEGIADDYGTNSYDPPMLSIETEKLEVLRLVKLTKEDSPVPEKLGYFEVAKDSLVPRNAFDGRKPDEINYEGYHGNESGPLEHHYKLSAFVMFHPKDTTAIVVSGKGVDWALEHVESKSLSLDTRIIIDAILKNMLKHDPIEAQRSRYMGWGGGRTEPHVKMVLDTALAWKEPDHWNKAFPYVESGRTEEFGHWKKAIKVFTLDQIRPGLLRFVKKRYYSLSDKVGFLETISKGVGAERNHAWLVSFKKEVVASNEDIRQYDAKYFLALAQDKDFGLDYLLSETILNPARKLSDRSGCPEFFKELAKGFHKLRSDPSFSASIPSTDSDGTRASTLDRLIQRCLTGASHGWSQEYPRPSAPTYPGPLAADNDSRHSQLVTTILEFIALCLEVNDTEVLATFLASVFKAQKGVDIATRFWHTLTPLAQKLRPLVEKYGKTLASEPFALFMKQIVSLYLAGILGDPTTPRPLPRMALQGCSWRERYDGISTFLNSFETEYKHTLKEGSEIPKEIEDGKLHLGGNPKALLKDLVTHTEPQLTNRLRREWTVVLTKRPEFLAVYSWEARQAAAKTFLEGIADTDELKVIMGDRFGDMEKALEGTCAFEVGEELGVINAEKMSEDEVVGYDDDDEDAGDEEEDESLGDEEDEDVGSDEDV